jgi:quercetin dioxygenase-like cupin family protein
MWQVEMTAGASGPLHVFDSEQIWTLLDGELSVAIAGQCEDIRSGDTVVIPADLERQLFARTDVRLLVCGHGNAIARVPGEPEPRGVPAWIA